MLKDQLQLVLVAVTLTIGLCAGIPNVLALARHSAPHDPHAHRHITPIPALHRNHKVVLRKDLEKQKRKAETNFYFDVEDANAADYDNEISAGKDR